MLSSLQLSRQFSNVSGLIYFSRLIDSSAKEFLSWLIIVDKSWESVYLQIFEIEFVTVCGWRVSSFRNSWYTLIFEITFLSLISACAFIAIVLQQSLDNSNTVNSKISFTPRFRLFLRNFYDLKWQTVSIIQNYTLRNFQSAQETIFTQINKYFEKFLSICLNKTQGSWSLFKILHFRRFGAIRHVGSDLGNKSAAALVCYFWPKICS